jgi:hypothetical protein
MVFIILIRKAPRGLWSQHEEADNRECLLVNKWTHTGEQNDKLVETTFQNVG